MRTFAAAFFLSAVLAIGGTAAAAPPAETLRAVVDTLEKGYNSLTDMQADFVQTTVISSVKRQEKGAGEVFIKKQPTGPAMFRFNYRKPKQQIVSNGRTVWYYIEENNQVMVSDMSALQGIALNYLTGMGRISRDFTITFAGSGRDKKGNYVIDLVPKKESQAVARLQLTVDGKAVERFQEERKAEAQFPVVSSVVTDSMGNRTTIDFSRIKINRGLGSDRFTFKIPAGAEVIKQ